ncbi:MAG: aspartate--tRNA(Asn) ligase [Nitrososphaerales archaeon]|nr:aspartate--tRNA(Asn) ligase [Nitrososphaerales archaeon]
MKIKRLAELEGWRRSHYSIDITPSCDGAEVTVFGWVASIREQGGITFLILQDREGILQITIRKDEVSPSIIKKVRGLSEHSIIAVKGIVRSIEKAPHGAEVIPKEIKILALAQKTPPFQLFSKTQPSLDKRLDLRAVDLRRPVNLAIFKIRHHVLTAIREFLLQEGYWEVNTSKIIATATEGGAALFPILYYDKEGFLAQSPQLYKEQLTIAFEKVFEIGPVFRAEPSRTLRHLAEITSVDIEEAYVNYEDVMATLSKLIQYVIQTLQKRCINELNLLNVKLKVPDLPLKRYTYNEVLEILNKEKQLVKWGEDLSTPALKVLGEKLPEFYFITDWPTASKPFYIKPREDNPEICEAFDFMHGSIEIASGGTRVNSKRLLMKRLKEQGLKPQQFEYHLKLFDYGMPPHAGFGLGLERLMMVLTQRENIREVTLFPRDRLRLVP